MEDARIIWSSVSSKRPSGRSHYHASHADLSPHKKAEPQLLDSLPPQGSEHPLTDSDMPFLDPPNLKSPCALTLFSECSLHPGENCMPFTPGHAGLPRPHSYFPYFSEKIRTLSSHYKPPTPLHACPHFYAFPAEFWVPTSLPYSRTLLLQLPHVTGITDCPFYPDNSFSIQTRC